MPDTPTPDFASNSQMMQRLLMQSAAEKARAASWAQAAQYAPESIESQVERERVRKQKWETAAQESIRATQNNIPTAETAAAQQRSVDAAYEQMREANARYQAEQLEQIRQSQSTQNASSGRPSTASPPPTPRTSGGAGNVVDMVNPPPTASPRQTLTGPNPAPGAKPSGLPSPPGRLAYPAAGAAIDFAFRVGSGQPLGQAAAGAAGSFAGSLAGAALGSALGPMGTFAGGMIGGYIGGVIGNALYNAAFPPPAALGPATYTGNVPFKGGQGGISYFVEFQVRATGGPSDPRIYTDLGSKTVNGAVGGMTSRFINTDGFGNTYTELYVISQGKNESVGIFSNVVDFKITRITTQSGEPDIYGDPPPLPVPKDNRSLESVGHPGNTSFAPPSAAPQITNITNNFAPNLAPNNYAPGGFASRSGGTPRGDSPNWIPKGNLGPSPHPNTAPPPVNGLPGSAPSGSPSSTGAPGPNAAGTPGGAPMTLGDTPPSPFTFNPDGSYTIVSPGSPLTTGNPKTNPADTSFPGSGFQPKIFQPNPLTSNPLVPGAGFSSSPNPNTGTPSGLPTTTINNPTPDAQKKTPTAPPTPQPSDPTQEFQKLIEDLKKKQEQELAPVLAALVGLTALINPIANNTTPEALRDAAETGTCRTLQPGGCMAPLAQNAANAANNSANNGAALSGLMAFLQALQAIFLQPILAGVNLINTKLGPVMAGVDGIGGFLSRLSKSLGVDRALNLIAIAANLHNAMMLSANLKITLLEMLSSVGNATGLLQTSENENVDLNQVFNKGIENLIISIVGAENYAGLKLNFQKLNPIYQSATNSLNAVSSMFNSMGNVIEQGAEYTGKIGNSLKGAGVVAENAYQWMAEKFDTKSNKFIKFESKIGDVTQVLETINEIAQSVVEGQQAATEFQKANAEFVKAVEDAKKNPGIENKAIKEEAEKAKASLITDPTGEDETGLLSFITDF